MTPPPNQDDPWCDAPDGSGVGGESHAGDAWIREVMDQIQALSVFDSHGGGEKKQNDPGRGLAAPTDSYGSPGIQAPLQHGSLPLTGFQSAVCPAPADPSFQRFVTATLAADWACYPNESEQVERWRLHHVLSAYPTGFRTYFIQHQQRWLPVGYSGFYPVSNTLHGELAAGRVPTLDRQSLLPDTSLPHSGLFYVFNYSVVPAFLGSWLSRTLVGDLSAALEHVQPTALCAITVSEAGQRVARRFGMSPVGLVAIGAKPEILFYG